MVRDVAQWEARVGGVVGIMSVYLKQQIADGVGQKGKEP